jgi:hypothetical protein
MSTIAGKLGCDSRCPLFFGSALLPAFIRNDLRSGGLQPFAHEFDREFQKSSMARAPVSNSPLAALARLGLARDYPISGDTVRAGLQFRICTCLVFAFC